MSSSAGPIRLGLMSPFSGLVELYGPEISWAGQIAADEINQAGGVLGRPLELVVVDDGSLPDTAVPAANRLIDEEKCAAIIGNLLSNSRIAVAGMVADPKKVPYLNFSFYEGSIWSRYFFHFAALPNQQIEKMIPYMADQFGSKMFFAGSNYEWPRGSIDAAKRSLLAHGGEIVGETYLPFGTDNFDDLLDELARSGADVFVPYFAGSDQTNLLTQFTERGLKSSMQVVMGHYDEAMVSLLPPNVREGFYSSNTYFMELDTPENKAYLDRLAHHPDVTGIWPQGNGVLTNFGEGTYLCVKAFAAAAERAGTVEAEAMVEALETLSVVGPQGTVTMDPNTHHARVNTHLSRCRADGTFEIIRSFGPLPPEIPARYRAQFPGLLDNKSAAPMKPRPEDAAMHSLQGEAAVLHTFRDGTIASVNPRACEMFGYDADEFVGLSIHLLLPPHLREQHKIHFDRFAQSDRASVAMGSQGDVFGYDKDGSQFPAQATITKIQRGADLMLIATVFDISDHLDEESSLAQMTRFDPLTGLLNRKMIEDRLTTALGRIVRKDASLCVLLLDVMNFQSLNAAGGFDEGDRVLKAVSDVLVGALGPGDTLGRIGGDEFVVIAERLTGLDEATAAAQALATGVADQVSSQGGVPVTLKTRVCCRSDAARTAPEILDDLLSGAAS